MAGYLSLICKQLTTTCACFVCLPVCVWVCVWLCVCVCVYIVCATWQVDSALAGFNQCRKRKLIVRMFHAVNGCLSILPNGNNN